MKRFLLAVIVIFIALPAYAVEITEIRAEQIRDKERISIRLSEPANYSVFTVDGLPPRVAVDVEATHWKKNVQLPQDYDGALVKDVRIGAFNTHTIRIVLDLTATAQPQHIRLIGDNGSYWLEFDLLQQRAVTKNNVANALPVSKKSKAKSTAEDIATRVIPTKPIIAIDAGHGGQDPGTSGRNGTQEKDITLAYAQALQEALLHSGHYRVFLTRSDDRYLFLRDRVKRARDAKANLFISLHADSAPSPSMQGLSVYTISEKSSDKETEALAAKENKADVIGGMDLSDTSEDVANILIDLTQRETRAKSEIFANLIVKNMARDIKLLPHLPHRFAGFAVLKAPDIPSVLVEIGFLTTPREERLIEDPAHQAKIAHDLVKAIDSYFATSK